MCIYCGTTYYRKIYEQHNGPIPREENGRSYEIHHIDGNHNNNELKNLRCISIKEHYDIHYSQKDWGACFKIAKRMNLSAEEISDIATKSNLKTMANGTNPFSKKEVRMKGTLAAREVHLEKIKNNEFHLQSGKIQSANGKERVAAGTHNLLGPEMNRRMIEDGSHPSKIKVTCPHCGKSGGKPGMMTRHFDKCKFKST